MTVLVEGVYTRGDMHVMTHIRSTCSGFSSLTLDDVLVVCGQPQARIWPGGRTAPRKTGAGEAYSEGNFTLLAGPPAADDLSLTRSSTLASRIGSSAASGSSPCHVAYWRTVLMFRASQADFFVTRAALT